MPVAAEVRVAYAHVYNHDHRSDRKRSEVFRRRWASGLFGGAPLQPAQILPGVQQAFSFKCGMYMRCQIIRIHDAPKAPNKYPLMVTVAFFPDLTRNPPFAGGLEDVAVTHCHFG